MEQDLENPSVPERTASRRNASDRARRQQETTKRDFESGVKETRGGDSKKPVSSDSPALKDSGIEGAKKPETQLINFGWRTCGC